MKRNYKLSRFNYHLGNFANKIIILNTISGSIANIDEKMFDELRKGCLEKDNRIILKEYLQKNFIVPTNTNELKTYFQTVSDRHASINNIEITFISCPQNIHLDNELKIMGKIGEYVKTIVSGHNNCFFKLRFCGYRHRSISERLELFKNFSSLLPNDVPGISMWMTNSIEELYKIVPSSAGAIFARWNLAETTSGIKEGKQIGRTITKIISKRAPIYIQMAVKDEKDVKRNEAGICSVIETIDKKMRNWIRWGINLPNETGDSLYFKPETCARALSYRGMARRIIRKVCDDIGIHVDPAIGLFHLHSGCPYENKLSHIFDWRGNVCKCIKEYHRNHCIFESKDSPCSHGLKLFEGTAERMQCLECSLLPICEAWCKQDQNVLCKDVALWVKSEVMPLNREFK